MPSLIRRLRRSATLLVAVSTGSIGIVGISLAVPLAVRPAGAQMLNPDLVWTAGPLEPMSQPGSPIAESSPTIANLSGGPAVVVGDRLGLVHALDLAHGGSMGGGWPAQVGAPVDSSPSVSPDGSGVFVGAGNAAQPVVGGYVGINPAGGIQWTSPVINPPSDAQPDGGVQASLSVGNLQGHIGVVAGSLGQEDYALDAGSGATLPGWPFFASDSNFSTPALADLYGTGQTEIVEGGDQSAGFAFGQTYTDGGHLRILNTKGGLICHDDTNQTVDSSPAVGAILPGGATGIVVGTGNFFPGASDTDTVKGFDTLCHQVWSSKLDGSTASSPALANVEGNGQLQVVEGTDTGSGGSVWVLNAATGAAISQFGLPAGARVIGSITTADLTGAGYQDLLVPTTLGVYLLDGRSGAQLTSGPLGNNWNSDGIVLGFQNSPLVTVDPGDGDLEIIVAGYGGVSGGFGYVQRYELPGSSSYSGAAVGAGAWPQFHHDPQLTGNAGGAGSMASCSIPSAAFSGYNLVATDGGIFSFGAGLPFCGSTGNLTLNAPVVGMAMAPNTGGYWFVAADGGIFAYGGARFYGSMGGQHLNQPIVGMAATPDGLGYWLVASDGGMFAFGDAAYFGSMGGQHLNQPIVGMSATPDGLGYRLVASDGGIFAFGDAQYFGSMGGQHLNQPIVGITTDVATGGYWMVASDGGIFAFFAPFFGSMGGQPLNQPIVGMTSTLAGDGYRFVAADGGIFAFGDAPFFGSMGGQPLNRPVVGMAGFS